MHFCIAVKHEELELHSVSGCCVTKASAQACVEDLRRRETCETRRGRQRTEGWAREGRKGGAAVTAEPTATTIT